MDEFKYIIVGSDLWTQKEVDLLNIEYEGVAKWLLQYIPQ